MWTFTYPLLQVNVSFQSIALLINSSLFPVQTHALCHFLSLASYAPGVLPSPHISLSSRTCFFDTSFWFTSERRDRMSRPWKRRGTGHGGFELFWSEIDWERFLKHTWPVYSGLVVNKSRGKRHQFCVICFFFLLIQKTTCLRD